MDRDFSSSEPSSEYSTDEEAADDRQEKSEDLGPTSNGREEVAARKPSESDSKGDKESLNENEDEEEGSEDETSEESSEEESDSSDSTDEDSETDSDEER